MITQLIFVLIVTIELNYTSASHHNEHEKLDLEKTYNETTWLPLGRYLRNMLSIYDDERTILLKRSLLRRTRSQRHPTLRPRRRIFGGPLLSSNSRNGYHRLVRKKPLYNFGYVVQADDDTQYGHTEKGYTKTKRGSYFIDQPDGFRRTISYIANGAGYYPFISLDKIPPDKYRKQYGTNHEPSVNNHNKFDTINDAIFRADTDVIFDLWKKAYETDSIQEK